MPPHRHARPPLRSNRKRRRRRSCAFQATNAPARDRCRRPTQRDRRFERVPCRHHRTVRGLAFGWTLRDAGDAGAWSATSGRWFRPRSCSRPATRERDPACRPHRRPGSIRADRDRWPRPDQAGLGARPEDAAAAASGVRDGARQSERPAGPVSKEERYCGRIGTCRPGRSVAPSRSIATADGFSFGIHGRSHCLSGAAQRWAAHGSPHVSSWRRVYQSPAQAQGTERAGRRTTRHCAACVSGPVVRRRVVGLQCIVASSRDNAPIKIAGMGSHRPVTSL